MGNRCLRAACCGAMLLMSGCVLPWFSSSMPAAPVRQGEQAVPGATPAALPEHVARKENLQPSRPVPEKATQLIGRAKKLWIGEFCSDPEMASAMLDAALELDPDNAEARLWRGRALSDAGYLADAFDDLTRSIQLQPTAMAYAARGLAGLRLGNAVGADQDIARALELDDGEPLAYVYRAARLFLQGQDAKACADLASACKRGLCEPEQNAHRDKLCR